MEIEKIIDDLCLIDNVVVDYSQGRRRGLTDEETEDRAMRAVSSAMERLEKTKTNKHIGNTKHGHLFQKLYWKFKLYVKDVTELVLTAADISGKDKHYERVMTARPRRWD